MKIKLNKLVDLPNHSWHHVTMRMAWYYRTGGQMDVPPVVLATYHGEVPDKDTWAEHRRTVNAIRKAHRASEERYASQQKYEKRKAYQRDYMRQYRARARGTNAAG